MNNLRTVGDFYKAGLVFVAGDIGIVSVETPFNEIGISNCNKGFCDAFGVHSFAWRANTDGWVPSFDGEVEYECRNGEKGVCQITMLGFSLLALNPCIKWRPHLDLTPQAAVPSKPYDFASHVSDVSKPDKAKAHYGSKHDQLKPRYDLLPAVAIDELAKVLTFGAEKYAPNSWRNVPDAKNRYRAALLRHTFAIQRGEMVDEESGLPHSAMAMCNAAFLVELEKC